jgi:hypothetical protein
VLLAIGVSVAVEVGMRVAVAVAVWVGARVVVGTAVFIAGLLGLDTIRAMGTTRQPAVNINNITIQLETDSRFITIHTILINACII